MQKRFRGSIVRSFMALGFALSSVFAFAQFSISPTSSNCGCDGSAVFTLPNGTAANYEIRDRNGSLFTSGSTANGQITITNLCASFYSLTLTQGAISTVFPFNVASPTMSIGTAATDSICYNGGIQDLNLLLAGITPGGTWYDINGIALNPAEFDPLTDPEGLYTYGIQAGGCEVTTGLNLQIIQNPGIFTFYLICESTTPFHLIDAMFGYPETGGTWTTLTGTATTDMFDPATFGNSSYRYTLSTHPQCAPSTSVLVIQPDPEPYAGEDTTILTCADGVPFNLFAQLPGNPQAGGTWANNANGQAISATFDPTVMSPGVYRYRVQGSGPCGSDFSYVTINYVPTNPSGASASQIICPGDPAMDMFPLLGGSPLLGGVWTGPNNLVTDNTFDPSSDPFGNYHYAYPSVGCSPIQTTLSISAAPVPNAGLDNTGNICQNSGQFDLNNLLTAGASPGGFWTNSSGSVLATPMVNTPIVGSFNYTYHIAAGSCPEDVSAITLYVNSPMPAIANQALNFCSTDGLFNLSTLYPTHPTIQFTNSSGAPISAQLDPALSTSGTITVILPSPNSCPNSTASISVTIDQPAFDSISYVLNTCESATPFHLNSVSNTVDFNQGQWYDSANIPMSEVVSIASFGHSIYHFTTTGSGACPESELQVDLTVEAPINAGADTSFTYCHDEQAVPFTTMLPISAATSGTWALNNSPVTALNFDPSTSTPGDYIFTTTPGSACPSDHAILTINVDYGFNATAGEDIAVCSTESTAQLGGQTINGIAYSWTPVTGLSSASISNPTISLANLGNAPILHEYHLEATDGVCSVYDTVSVAIYPLPSVNASSSVELCLGESTILIASGAQAYNWQPAGIFSNNTASQQNLTPTSSVVVQLLAYNEWNCVSTRTIDVTVHPLPQIVIETDTLVGCSPVTFSGNLGSGSINIQSTKWYLDNTLISSTDQFSTTVYSEGIYDLTAIAESEFGCTDTISVQQVLEVNPLPNAGFTIFPPELNTLDHLATFTNTSSGANQFVWDIAGMYQTNEYSPVYDFPADESLTFQICLEAKNSFGCRDTVCRFLPLVNEYVFYAPNAFSPDNDGINDTFNPVFQGFDNSSYVLQIFDRWGELVFETKDPAQPWTGNIHGGAYYCEGGIYIWQVHLKDRDRADIKKFRGHVTLLR